MFTLYTYKHYYLYICLHLSVDVNQGDSVFFHSARFV